MHDSPHPRLLGDIGGTNARFAWQLSADAPPSEVATYRCSAHASLLDAIQHYLAEHGKTSPRQCAIAIANPITGDQVTMTNHHWSFSISALQGALAAERLVVVNDFTALALSLPHLDASALRPIGAGAGVAGAPLAVLGAGTGLGVSGLVRDAGGQWVPLTGEGGHVTLAAADEHEARVVELLRRRFGHASAERALSGPGLVNLYEAQAALLGLQPQSLPAAEIVSRARTDADATCRAAIELFCSFLGGVAGNLALTLGARGGVYIGGGIAPRLLPELEGSSFRARFEAKGRFQSFLAGIPTYVIDAAVSPAFLGASKALDRSA